MELNEIVKKFNVEKGDITYLDKYGEGHINVTYLVKINNSKWYILQKINNHIFPNVERLMENINLVLNHLRTKKKNSHNLDREVMNLIFTNDGKPFYYCSEDDAYFRMYDFVMNSVALQKITNVDLFKESAIGFGKFALELSDFDASKLYEVIPNFHNTKIRYEHFLKTLSEDKCDRKKNCLKEIDFVLTHNTYMNKIVDLIESKQIPLRVTHNDTKLNNILLDESTYKSLCVIDLDTVMPGSILYDFGDSIRFGCNTGKEDDEDLNNVQFNIDYFEGFVEGYLSQVKSSLNQVEIDNLPFGALLMTLECGMRFLDDYLDGDHYFATKYSEHNLIRCRTQFKLVSEMEKQIDKLIEIVHKY